MEYPMKTMDDEWRYPHDFGTPQMIGSESCSYFNSNTIRRILCIYIYNSLRFVYEFLDRINIGAMWIYYSEMVVPKGPIHPFKWEFDVGWKG